MKYINNVNETIVKEFFEQYLSDKHLTFVKMTRQAFGIGIRYCYNENYSSLHNMMIFDYHVSCTNSVLVSKLWKAFMFEKYGEEYLKDFEEFYLSDFKNTFKRKYDEFVKNLKLDYEEKENDIKKQVKEVKKIVEKKNNENEIEK